MIEVALRMVFERPKRVIREALKEDKSVTGSKEVYEGISRKLKEEMVADM